MEIKCEYDELVPISKLVHHPRNPNQHSDDQIKRLSDIMAYQGMRHPIIVSKQTGFIVVGHGRLAAAKKLGMAEVPVDYQDFENEAQEYAFIVSDNAIADWAELDLSMINNDAMDLGPDFDIDLLGIKDFEIEPAEKFGAANNTSAELDIKSFDNFEHQCPKCGFEWNSDGSDNS